MRAQSSHRVRLGNRLLAVTMILVMAVALAGCGHKTKQAVGPDVRGLNLTDAEAVLKKHDVAYTEHATDATFGIIIKDNFVVCSEAYVNKHEVRLEVAKHGC